MLKFEKEKSAAFLRTNETYGFLSNMCSGYPTVLNSNTFRTTEHLYQSLRFTEHPDVQKKIAEQASPITAKMVCRENIEKGRADWEDTKIEIMHFCISLKVLQNEEFKQKLLKTGDLEIVEISYKNQFWGATPKGNFYIGDNTLGLILSSIRDDVKNSEFSVEVPNLGLKIFGIDLRLE